MAALSQAKHHVEPWPRGVDRTPKLSIGSVVEQVSQEFPTLTVSKLRYMETLGLVNPHRTKSGYRKYCAADVERVRFCLAAQRDTFKPWESIREDLRRLDAGLDISDMDQPIRLVTSGGDLVTRSPQAVTIRELEDACGVDEEDIEAIMDAGLIRLNLRGRFDSQAIAIVTLVKQLAPFGIEPRHLRAFKLAADRAADIVDQVVATRARNNAEKRADMARELGEAMAQLVQVLIRTSVDETNC